MRPLRPSVLAPLAAVLAFAACGEATAPASARLVALPRPLTPIERTAIDANTRFGLALFRRLAEGRGEAENLVISPLSVSTSLAMATVGARDSTFADMRATLGFADGVDRDALLAAYRALLPMLASLDPRVEYTLANAIWTHDAFPVDAGFVTAMQQGFGAEARTRDLFDPATAAEVNGWVRDRTRGRIPTMVDGFGPRDRLFLANAIAFKGDWRMRFDPAATVTDSFRVVPGTTLPVRMMVRSGGLRMGAVEGTRVVELPYGNDSWVMTILVPPPGGLRALVASLDESRWRRFTDTATVLFDAGAGGVALPRFRSEMPQPIRLDSALRGMGMARAFTPCAADFTRMSPLGHDLYVGTVLHRTFVEVDETGTTAAASTGVAMLVPVNAPPFVRVDRPFVFAIRERLSGTILFLGAIASPTSAPAP